MPLGGSNILWDESDPAETSVADAGPIRSIKTSVRNAMGSEHLWNSTGGVGSGVHLLGSARPFYDVQSNVSSSGTDGRLLVTSDSSRLFHVGSGGTMFLGGQTAISAGSSPVGGQQFYWALEFGEDKTGGLGTKAVTIPNSGFSGVPFTQVSVRTDSPGSPVLTVQVYSQTKTAFNVSSFSGAATASNTSFFWQSIGTRTF